MTIILINSRKYDSAAGKCRGVWVAVILGLLWLTAGPVRARVGEPGPAEGRRESRGRPRDLLRIVFPAEDKIYFSTPITPVVFRLTDEAKAAGIEVSDVVIDLDGERVPAKAVGRIHLLTGRNHAILSHRLSRSSTEGGHRVVARAQSADGTVWESSSAYVIETSHPSLSGLSGFMVFPSNEAIFSRSARTGLRLGPARELGRSVWFNLAPLQFHPRSQLLPVPLEFGINYFLSGPLQGDMRVSWKMEPIAQEGTRPGFGFGQTENDVFAVLGWHTNPKWFQGSIGLGGGRLPTGFFGLSYSPSFYRFMVEGDSSRKFNWGTSLTHPRGFRLSVYNLQSGLTRRTWHFQLSLSRGL